MEKIRREIKTQETIYIANDGTEHDTDFGCLVHEWRLQADKIFLVNYRGARSENSEAFSSLELATESTNDETGYIITQVYINERIEIEQIEENLK